MHCVAFEKILDRDFYEEFAICHMKARLVIRYRIQNGLVCIPDDQLLLNTAATLGHDEKHIQTYRINYYKGTFFPTSSHYGIGYLKLSPLELV